MSVWWMLRYVAQVSPEDSVLITQLLGVLSASGSWLHLQGLPWPKESCLAQARWPFPEQPVTNGQ